MNKQIQQIAKEENKTYQEVEGVINLIMEGSSVGLEAACEIYQAKGTKIVTLKEAAENQDKSEKQPCGMEQLDEAMGGGISWGSSVVVAAPSGEGKTQFMVSMSYHFLNQDIPCLWFSFEENVADIWERFKLTKIDDKVPAFCPMDLEDNKLNYLEKVIQIFKLRNKGKKFVVFIDQLSFLAPKLKEKTDIDNVNGNYSMYLGLISNQIKELAMENQIIIVFAHQLGRTGDVAYSDMIKHAPDKVIYLKRQPAKEDADEEFTDKTFVIFKKNRPFGSRPRLAMTVDKGLFVPMDNDLTKFAEENLGWKKTEYFHN